MSPAQPSAWAVMCLNYPSIHHFSLGAASRFSLAHLWPCPGLQFIGEWVLGFPGVLFSQVRGWSIPGCSDRILDGSGMWVGHGPIQVPAQGRNNPWEFELLGQRGFTVGSQGALQGVPARSGWSAAGRGSCQDGSVRFSGAGDAADDADDADAADDAADAELPAPRAAGRGNWVYLWHGAVSNQPLRRWAVSSAIHLLPLRSAHAGGGGVIRQRYITVLTTEVPG